MAGVTAPNVIQPTRISIISTVVMNIESHTRRNSTCWSHEQTKAKNCDRTSYDETSQPTNQSDTSQSSHKTLNRHNSHEYPFNQSAHTPVTAKATHAQLSACLCRTFDPPKTAILVTRMPYFLTQLIWNEKDLSSSQSLDGVTASSK